jgi:HAMP domain-containing protein
MGSRRNANRIAAGQFARKIPAAGEANAVAFGGSNKTSLAAAKSSLRLGEVGAVLKCFNSTTLRIDR